jgi:hypothetical protein
MELSAEDRRFTGPDGPANNVHKQYIRRWRAELDA